MILLYFRDRNLRDRAIPEDCERKEILITVPCHKEIVNHECSEFGQDRVNFHQKPEGNTAQRADPNWLNKTGVFDTMCCHAGF